MPWCSTCDRFLSPNTVAADGTCPSCGRPVDASATPLRSDALPSHEVGAGSDVATAEADDGVKAPWHFWLMVAGVVVYLGWRLVEGIFWAAQHWF